MINFGGENRYKFLAIALTLLLVGLFFLIKDKSVDPYDDGMTLKKAAKIGESVTHKLSVQIEESKGEGRYERGDVVLTASSTKQFSRAEREGFLIIKMDLTPTQADVLVRSLNRVSELKNSEGEPGIEVLKRRRYAVDLEQIGIAKNDYRGREIDQIYKWDILYEK